MTAGPDRLPDPALVVLVGPSGSGKSTWAAGRYRRDEIVSSDALRGVVGSGPHDLDASDDAFALLEQIVNARLGRGLTTVVDTLGLDDLRRRRRNRRRDRPVPAPAIAAQLEKAREARTTLDLEGWDLVQVVEASGRDAESAPQRPLSSTTPDRRSSRASR